MNNSPVSGKDGKYVTLHDISTRMRKEAVTNPAIEVAESADKQSVRVQGRGELQLGILIEEMRREGYEMTLSPPVVVTQTDVDTGSLFGNANFLFGVGCRRDCIAGTYGGRGNTCRLMMIACANMLTLMFRFGDGALGERGY